jgi:hypothetical protein
MFGVKLDTDARLVDSRESAATTWPLGGHARDLREPAPASRFAPDSAPFFHARRVADGFTVDGDLAREFGHRVPARSGSSSDGVFAGWKWDGRKLTVEIDRYGFYPLFYFCRDDEFAISTSLIRLLEAAPLEVDSNALAVFIHFGFFIGNDTAFRHIKVVPPNHGFTWDGSLHVREVRHLGSQLAISRTEAINTYAELFRDAILKRLPRSEDFAVPLSGGRDSRHILLELNAAGFRPKYCITANKYGAGDNDVAIARLLTETLGLQHVVPERVRRLEAERRKHIATSFCADEHGWLMQVGEILRHSVDTIYDGIAGDVLSASLFQDRSRLDLHRAGRFRELAAALMKPSTDALQRTLDPAYRVAQSTEIAREQIARELERYAGATNPTSMVYFWNRTRREIALSPFGVFADVRTSFCPYLDHPLFDFLASLPGEMLLDKTFHTDTISAAHPRFARIPYSAPRQSRALLQNVTFGLDVAGYGLRTRPARIGRMARLAAQVLRFGLSASYRNRNAVINPLLLLYFFHLEETRGNLARARRGDDLPRLHGVALAQSAIS